MSWADSAIKTLSEGQIAQIRPRGNSMKGKVESGNLVTIEPVPDLAVLKVDDIVLVKVKGRVYLHLIKAVDGERFQIGNNKGGINGWTGGSSIYGRATKVEP